MNNPILRVLNSAPVDKKAAIVAAQRRCSDDFLIDGKDDLCQILSRLGRKRRLIESLLRITTDSQRDNVKERFKAGRRQRRPRRIVEEYIRVGQNIVAVALQLAAIKRSTTTGIGIEPKSVRRLVGERENQWKAEHPGWIWAGSCHIAPNGAVFVRDEVLREVKEALHA